MPQNDRQSFLIAPFGALVTLALLLLFGFFEGEGGTQTLLRVAVFQLVAFGAALVLFGPSKGRRREVLPMGKLTGNEWKLLLSALFALAFLAAGVKFGFSDGAYGHGATVLYGFSLTAPASFGEGVLLLLSAAVLPAVLEEILFRGVIFDAYRHAGVTGSILLSALFSAMLGTSFGSFPVLFLAGLAFGVIRFLTGKLTASVLLHMAYGVYVLFGQALFYRLSLSPVSRGLFTLLMLFFFGIALFFFLCFAEKVLRGRDGNAPVRIPKNRRAIVLIDVVSAPLFSVTVCLYLVVAVLRLFLS